MKINGLYINSQQIDASWFDIIQSGLEQLSTDYIKYLQDNANWLPGPEKLLNAFSLPLNRVKYILFGESPYPRANSANGYAFWDNAVTDIWSTTGFSKSVNRATSLRNFIKMLLVANNLLPTTDLSQAKIAAIEKGELITTLDQLFIHMQQHGILLLNAALVLSSYPVAKEAKAWLPFVDSLLQQLAVQTEKPTLLLLGNIAKRIDKLAVAHKYHRFYAEHPYNISFITNPDIIKFFQPFNLLDAS